MKNKYQAFYYVWMLTISAFVSITFTTLWNSAAASSIGLIWFLLLVVALLLEAFVLEARYYEYPSGLEWFFLVFFAVFTPLTLIGVIWEIYKRKNAPPQI